MDRTPAPGRSPAGPERGNVLGTFIWQASGRVRAAAGRAPGTVVACRLIGGSMEHAIPARSWIRIGFVDDPCRTGAVVAFMEDARVVAHRVVYRAHGRSRGFVVTRGDARLLPDMPVHAAAVLGRVDEIDAGSGWRPPGAQTRLPRRDRLLAFALLAATALLLELNPDLARRFAAWLEATDRSTAWTRSLLY